MPATRVFVFGLALMSGVAAAQAQTVITRQISEEPVETTITQGPYGTVITRRPLDTSYRRVIAPGYVAPGYVAPGYATPGYVAPGYAPPGYGTVQVRSLNPPAVVIEESDDDDEDVVETVRVRTVPARVAAPVVRARPLARRGSPPIMARAVEPEDRPVARVRRVSAPLALRPAQREIVYRTIVRERVYAPPAVVQGGYAVAPVGYVASPYVATNAVAYAVGAPVPQRVALVAVPQTLTVQVPVTRGYRYAVVNNRVLLVDPATNIIVADVTP
ncbi:MAG: DUF1236 domain-containing protein [Rhodoplanes sp.]|jgi:hypothetical protein|nr:DUF1236 domain-containing protein [Rhodoplanes sp.]